MNKVVFSITILKKMLMILNSLSLLINYPMYKINIQNVIDSVLMAIRI